MGLSGLAGRLAGHEQVIVVADTCAILSHVQELIDRDPRFSTFGAELYLQQRGAPAEEVVIFLPSACVWNQKNSQRVGAARAARALELNGPGIVWQSAMDYAGPGLHGRTRTRRRSTNMIVAVASGTTTSCETRFSYAPTRRSTREERGLDTNDREFQGKMRRNGVPTYVSPQLELR